MSSVDPPALALELAAAYANRQLIPTLPSSRDGGLDLAAAYAVESELVHLRTASGQRTVGRKVGFANKAMWRVLKLDTLVWAHMYDDTVRFAEENVASLSLEAMFSPRIEPEIVFKLKRPLEAGGGTVLANPAAVLESVEWLALGFEIIDCVFPDWKFQPADFVASFGLHAGLIVGAPLHVDRATIPELAERLPAFTIKLLRDGQLIDEGSGKNSLRSPALCLGELAAGIARRGSAPLAAGELVSSGTLTAAQPIKSGETWTAVVDGLSLHDLTLGL